MNQKPTGRAFGVAPALAACLAAARSVVVLTGAGVSAESGVPTFRDAQTGLWAKFDPRQLATPEAFAENPRRVWEWYAWRRERVAQAKPNPAHLALVAMERRAPQFLLVTQNIDGLHAQAGSRRMVELHGNLFRTVCSRDRQLVESWTDDAVPPRCPSCGAPLRPDVVWFGEMLPAAALAQAERAVASADLFVTVGTSAEVFPAAALPGAARAAGATVVEVNPDATAVSPLAAHVLRGAAGAVLPAWVAAAWPSAG